MSNCVAFHTQIASIMEVLANAAVAEICQVVDDGYAVLRLEMSQYQKENKTLKRRLQMMERQTARRCAERGGMRASFADGAQIFREVREKTRAMESVLDNRIDVSLKRDEQPIVLDEDDAEPATRSDGVPSHQNANSAACADMEEGRTEPVLIKEERLKEKMENSDHQGELRKEDGREVGSEAGDKGSPPSAEMQTASAKQEQPADQLSRTKRSIWELSGLECGLEADAEKARVKALQRPGPESRARRLNSLDSEFVMFERPSQLGSYCTQGGASTETEDPCCSYSTEVGPQSLSFHSEMRSFPATEEGGGNGLSPLASLEWKPDVVVIDSAPVKLETEMPSAWNTGTIIGMGNAQERPFEEIGERGEIQPESVTNLCLPPVQMTAGDKATVSKYIGSENKTHHRANTSDERSFYTHFERGFGRTKDGEMHQGVDTEERQFRCTQCGKHFAHSANLKRHQRVHTGEKPFSCTQCEKRFSHQHQLKMHQRVHTGERPFNCTHCGKRFTQSSHIKRHLLVHTGEMM